METVEQPEKHSNVLSEWNRRGDIRVLVLFPKRRSTSEGRLARMLGPAIPNWLHMEAHLWPLLCESGVPGRETFLMIGLKFTGTEQKAIFLGIL